MRDGDPGIGARGVVIEVRRKSRLLEAHRAGTEDALLPYVVLIVETISREKEANRSERSGRARPLDGQADDSYGSFALVRSRVKMQYLVCVQRW